jgi:hypothetical protein
MTVRFSAHFSPTDVSKNIMRNTIKYSCHDLSILRDISIRKTEKLLRRRDNKRSQQSTSRSNEILGKWGVEPEANSAFPLISHEIQTDFMKDQTVEPSRAAITADRLADAIYLGRH